MVRPSTSSQPQLGFLQGHSEVSWAYYLIAPIFVYVVVSAVGANEKAMKATSKLVCRILGLVMVNVCIFFGESYFPNHLPKEYLWPEAMMALSVTTWILLSFCFTSSSKGQGGLGSLGRAAAKSNDVYSDLTCPVQTSFLIFAVQSVLMQFYVQAAVDKTANIVLNPNEDLHGHTWQCFSASFIIQLMILTNAAESYPIGVWRLLRESKGRIRLQTGELADQSQSPSNSQKVADIKTGLVEVWIRMFMSFVVKMIYAKIIALTLPIVLSDAATSFDFLRDAVVVSFVTILDRRDVIKFEVVLPTQMTESDAELALSRSAHMYS